MPFGRMIALSAMFEPLGPGKRFTVGGFFLGVSVTLGGFDAIASIFSRTLLVGLCDLAAQSSSTGI